MNLSQHPPRNAMRTVRIDRVENHRDRRHFVEFARVLYRSDPHFVPPLSSLVLHQLDERKNPFFRHAEQALFLARENGRIRGRIAAIIDRDLQARHGRAVGLFGFLEAEDDPAVFAELMSVASAWLAERGVDEILGPIQHSTNYEAGLLVEGFGEAPTAMMTYNPPYYEARLLELGLQKSMDLLAYRIVDAGVTEGRFRRIADRARERSGVQFRTLNMRRFGEELESLRHVYNAAWQENWGFVPLSADEFQAQALDLKRVVRPELVVLAEKEGLLVAFAMALPDINQVLKAIRGRLLPFGWLRFPFLLKKLKKLRVITLGVVPEMRGVGVEAPMILEIIDRGRELGFDEAELSWVLETNHMMIKTIEAVGGHLAKRYRLYEAPLAIVRAKSSS